MATPCLRLLALGPPKHGKTTLLKGLAAQLGSWQKALLRVIGQSDLFAFSIREAYYPERTLRELATKHRLLDGLLLVINLSEPLDERTKVQLLFAHKIGVPLRLIIATHCDAFGGDEVMLDAYELSLKQQLSALGFEVDHIPVIRSAEDTIAESAHACINALHRLDWGVPLSARPLRMMVLKTEYPAPIFQVSLLQGTLRLQEKLARVCYEQRETQEPSLQALLAELDLVTKIATDAGEHEQLAAPCFARIWLHGAGRKPQAGALLAPPDSVTLARKARAHIYMESAEGAMMLWIPRLNSENVLLRCFFEGPTETLKMRVSPPRGFLDSLEICEAELECSAKFSKVVLTPGQSFFWRADALHHGGGVITELL